MSEVGYKFQCGVCSESYYDESIRHLDMKSGEHRNALPPTGKKVKSINNSSVFDHLLNCNYLPSFDNLSILAHEYKRFLLDIKESHVLIRDKPLLGRNISSTGHFVVVYLTSLVCFLLNIIVNI